MKHVVIVGAGVVGLCTACAAARRGFTVTVVDRHPAGQGCSYGNAGMVVPSHFVPLAAPGAVAQGLRWMTNPQSPFWIKPRLSWDLLTWGWHFWRAASARRARRAGPLLRDLHLLSRSGFESLAAESGNAFGLVTRGLLLLCKTPARLEEEAHVAEQASTLGIPVEVLDPRQTAQLEPAVRMEVAGAVFYPQDCHLTPQAFMAHLHAKARESGVQFVAGLEALQGRREGRRLRALSTAQGDLAADEFVLCGGTWTSVLAQTLGLRLPLQPGKGYTLTLEHPPRLPTLPAILSEARVAVTPMGPTLRLGGTLEIAGLNETVRAGRVRGIVEAVPHYYPEFRPEHFAGLQPWVGLRPCSPDGLPYLGRTAAFENVVVATGHAMMGLSLGPVTGQLVAEILAGERPSVDLQLLHPDRYA